MKKNLKTNIWLWIASALLVIVVAGFLIIPRNGREFEVDGICYKVVDDISNIVAVTCKGDSYDAYADEYAGAVVIPDNITYRGINYTVEQIDNEAFRDCSKMTSITIPPSVWHVGIGAFSGCSGLKEVHISDLSAWCELSFYNVADDAGDSPLNYADGLYLNGELVKDLASVFRTRIELRQIGVRDETKVMGGLGICGRELCCKSYLADFVPVSIKMAKEQNLSGTVIASLTIDTEGNVKDVNIVNVTGPETAGVKRTAILLGRALNKEVTFVGEEADTTYLNNAGKMFSMFGYPTYSLDTLIEMQSAWLLNGGRSLGKPTHFEERNGNY